MDPNLSTTNLLLAIMAVVSVLEGLLIIGLFVGGVIFYRRLSRALASLETNHVAPASARVNGVLDDIKAVTTLIRRAAEGLDASARSGLLWLLEKLRNRETGEE